MIRRAMLITVFLGPTLVGATDALALGGCCQCRKTVSSPWQKRPELEFTECDRKNLLEDNDDLTKPRGLWWWNTDAQCDKDQ